MEVMLKVPAEKVEKCAYVKLNAKYVLFVLVVLFTKNTMCKVK